VDQFGLAALKEKLVGAAAPGCGRPGCIFRQQPLAIPVQELAPEFHFCLQPGGGVLLIVAIAAAVTIWGQESISASISLPAKPTRFRPIGAGGQEPENDLVIKAFFSKTQGTWRDSIPCWNFTGFTATRLK